LVPSDFSVFFASSAGVAGALIGLLFVAISVAPAEPTAAQQVEFDIRAGVAFSALTDALTVSLFALIPGIDLGLAALVVAIGGIASCIAFIIVSVRAGELRQRWHKVRLLVLQGLVFAYQLVVAVALIGDDHDGTAIKTLAVLTVVFFLVGIARAWQLIGARDTGLIRLVREVITQRSSHTGSAP
jgi:hypothetical protein